MAIMLPCMLDSRRRSKGNRDKGLITRCFSYFYYFKVYFAIWKIILSLKWIYFYLITDLLKFTIVAYDNTEKKNDSVYSKRIRAGKRRTYFFDVRETRGSDYYLTITESRKRFDSDGYDRHKIFLYKEDFNKFIKGLVEAIDHVKTELMPDFDFDAFNHENPYEGEEGDGQYQPAPVVNGSFIEPVAEIIEPITLESTPIVEVDSTPLDNGSTEEVDKW